MADQNHRAGRYIFQPTGYSAFIPKGLPPDPPLLIDTEMWSLLSQADRSLGRLDGSTEILPNPDLFVFMYVRKEAVLSSQIEGTQASLIDVIEYEASALRRGKPEDITEVINYIAAMNHGLARLKKIPISLRLIREIHGILIKGVRGSDRNPGEFRTSQNWIGSSGATLSDASFAPPPPDQLLSCLDNLEKFIHQKDPMPLLIKVGLTHAQFETIHPFLDGNGRVGRLLITFMLCEHGALKRPLLYLSHYFKKNRQMYYETLQDVRDSGDWETWIKFFLRGIYEVAQEATETARLIMSVREAHRRQINEKFGATSGNALVLLESLYRNPIASVKNVAEVTKLAYANANNLVGKLVKMGILNEVTGKKRDRRFVYDSYFKLISDRE